jgi:tetratricopeptide (TPR) repeat protein
MARTILTTVLIVLLNVLVGCSGVDAGRSQLEMKYPGTAPVVSMAGTSEADMIEQVSLNRQAYRQGLEMLINYYTRMGDSMKLDWAKKELAGLEAVTQYKYVFVGGFAGPRMKADTSIPEADKLYEEASQIEKSAGSLPFLKDEKTLRLALNKYDLLIEKYSTSDKIDDAAFRAAGIYEYFKDYTIAVKLYKRVYQWDRYTIHPAKYRAAYVLDRKLNQREEALELYQEVVDDEVIPKYYKDFAKNRIAVLTKTVEEPKRRLR